MATRNRGTLIGVTLDSILSQITPECEIVIVDGASTDSTPRVVQCIAEQHRCVRYFRQETNGGLDQDFDQAIRFAHGTYCWLMPDDDIVLPGAIAKILSTLREGNSVILINVECRDGWTGEVLSSSDLEIDSDKVFPSDQLSELFKISYGLVNYLGSVVISRSLWLQRERLRYYNTEFVHVGVIFQEALPGGAYVIATPLIATRVGNHQWMARSLEVWVRKWPELVRSLPLSEAAKDKALSLANVFVTPAHLSFLRAIGSYSLEIYRRYLLGLNIGWMRRTILVLIAISPRAVLNAILLAYFSCQRGPSHAHARAILRRSQSCFWPWRINVADMSAGMSLTLRPTPSCEAGRHEQSRA